MPVVKPFRFLPNIKRHKEFNYEFVDYVWYRNLFNEEEVKQIKGLWDDTKCIDAKVNKTGEELDKDDLRKSKIMFIKPGEFDWVYTKLSEASLQANTNRFKFDVLGFQTELQLASYGLNDFFEWHMDFGAGDISNRKLSITVQLSDPDEYEGGELQFMINQNIFTAPKDKGTAIVFPSFALHRVQPVTKGNRMSIVGWIAGPPYK
jgi:PKHD-type hydroxylase